MGFIFDADVVNGDKLFEVTQIDNNSSREFLFMAFKVKGKKLPTIKKSKTFYKTIPEKLKITGVIIKKMRLKYIVDNILTITERGRIYTDSRGNTIKRSGYILEDEDNVVFYNNYPNPIMCIDTPQCVYDNIIKSSINPDISYIYVDHYLMDQLSWYKYDILMNDKYHKENGDRDRFIIIKDFIIKALDDIGYKIVAYQGIGMDYGDVKVIKKEEELKGYEHPIKLNKLYD